MQLNKNCIYCNKEFSKKYSCSLKEWFTTKYCSKKCFDDFRRGNKEYADKHINKNGLKIGWNLRGNRKSCIPWNKGRKMSEDIKQKIRLARLKQKNVIVFQSGNLHPNWKGGKTKLISRLRHCELYKLWRRKIFERDKWTCCKCGEKGYFLNADHIKPFSLIIHENNIQTDFQARDCKELWEIDNGRTLCVDCHRKTDTFAINTKFNINK